MDFKKKFYKRKMAMYLSVLLLLPFVIITAFSMINTYNDRKDALSAEMQNSIMTGLNRYKAIEDDVYAHMFFLLNHSRINDVINMKEHVEAITLVNTCNEINAAISAMYLGKTADNAVIYTTNPNAYSMSIIRRVDNSYSDYLNELPDDNAVYIHNEISDGTEMLSYYKKFYSNDEYYNVIKYSIPFHNVVDCFDNIKDKDIDLFIADKLGKVTRIEGSGTMYENESDIIASDKIYQSVSAQLFNGKVYAVLGNDGIKKEITLEFFKLFFIFFFLVLLFIFIIVFIINYFADGIAVMIECISKDDFSDLKNSTFYNKEVNILKDYIFELKENLIMETNEKYDMMVRSVSQRMSPHFLYNSLGAIKNISDNAKTKECISILVKYYRYIFKIHGNAAVVSEETEMLNLYVRMLQISYARDFEYTVYVEESLKNAEILGNMLQPLVENAFVHGVNSLDDGGAIGLRIFADNGDLVIEVTNTSKNPASEAEAINKGFDNEEKALGLLKKRIGLFYDSGFDLNSQKCAEDMLLVRVRISDFDIPGGVTK